MSGIVNESDFVRELQDGFVSEALEMIAGVESDLLALESNSDDPRVLESLFRLAHNLKGSAKAVGFDSLSRFSHKFEDCLIPLRSKKIEINPALISLLLDCADHLKATVQKLKTDPEFNCESPALEARMMDSLSGQRGAAVEDREPSAFQSRAPDKEAPQSSGDELLRVSRHKIDDLLNYLGEQVILQSGLNHAKQDLDGNRDLIISTINQLTKITHDLEQTALALRMVSLKQLFNKLERAASDTARVSNKKINFIRTGQENELDKSIVDALSDPLTHMVRNSVDHGIEPEHERLAAGKPGAGIVHLTAHRKGNSFYIEISDDGGGLDPERIRAKAVQSGLIAADARLSCDELFELIFRNGFSTKEEVSEISGRGIGMNVVKETLNRLKGTTTIRSEKGRGTTFTIRLPLTLAIFHGMLVRVGEERFVLPNSDVEKIMPLPARALHRINSRERVVETPDGVLPLIELGERLGRTARTQGAMNGKVPGAAQGSTLLITRTGNQRHALLIDEVMGQQRIVHKNLGVEARKIPGVSGATILGDGTVALILELSVLVNRGPSGGVAA